jgi:hypothetical protein
MIIIILFHQLTKFSIFIQIQNYFSTRLMVTKVQLIISKNHLHKEIVSRGGNPIVANAHRSTNTIQWCAPYAQWLMKGRVRKT